MEKMLQRMNAVVAFSLRNGDQIPKGIIDLGCGFGSTMLQLLQQFPTSVITGVNIDDEQLKFAQEVLSKAGFSQRASLMHANFQETGLPTHSFDAAYALETSCYDESEYKSAFITEASRLLRPGGKLVVVDGFRKHHRPLTNLVKWCYRKCTDAWAIPSLATIERFETELRKQGFENIEIKDISWNGLPSILHIPFVVSKLFISYLQKTDPVKRHYLQALLWTLAMSPFKSHFGYYIVICTKCNVE
ncbi:MAG: methyltransferase domain-containing protein [Bacteroidetes bacterium]|nr:methyltransferase domain-containing protein [Bacteroidota bacterium]